MTDQAKQPVNDLGFFLSHIFIRPAVRRNLNLSWPYFNWLALLFGIIPHSLPSGKKSKYSNFSAANSDCHARKSYSSDSKARFMCLVSDLGWASIILISNS